MSTPTENTSKKELVVIVRPSFVKITQQQDKKGNPCRAAVYNHILYSIACKARNTNNKEDVQNGRVYWYAKNEDIVEEMSHTWEVCTVRKEVNELVKRGFFGKISNPHWGADRTKHFVFGKEQCELLLNRCKELGICLFHLELPVDIIHLINLSNANDKNIGCTCNNYQMQMINLSKQNDKFIEAITEITTENTTEITPERESDAPTNTQPETFVGLSTDAPSQDVSSEEKQAPESVDHNTPQSDATLPVESMQGVDQPTLNVRIAPTSTPDNANKQDEQGRRMRTMAPKPPKDTSMSERIERVFLCLDRCAQEVSQDTTFTWTRSASAKKAIKELLESGKTVTEERAERVYKRMATMKPTAKGFTWADKMSIRNFCSQYDSQWLEILAEEKAPIITEVPRPTRPEYQKVTRDPNAPPLSVYVPEKKKVGRR